MIANNMLKTNINEKEYKILRNFFDFFKKKDFKNIYQLYNDEKEFLNKYGLFHDLEIICEDYSKNKKDIFFNDLENYNCYIFSNKNIPDTFLKEIIYYIKNIKEWVIKYLNKNTFPFLILHIDSNYSYIPRTYLYKERSFVRIGLNSCEINQVYIIHELMHAYSFILDRFVSELLCYYVEFTGIGLVKSFYKTNEEKFNVSINDILFFNQDKLPKISNLFFGFNEGSIEKLKESLFISFLLYYTYEYLYLGFGENKLYEYFKKIDSYETIEEKREYFETIFRFEIQKLDIKIKNIINSKVENNNIEYKSEKDLAEMFDFNTNYEFNDIIYYRTFLNKYSLNKDMKYQIRLLKIDFEIFKYSGSINKQFLNEAYLKIEQLLAEDKNCYDAWILFYYILSEFALINYKQSDKEDINENITDNELINNIKYTLEVLELLDNQNIKTKIVHGSFNLFFPVFFGANRNKGIKLLEEAYNINSNSYREIYFYLIFYYYKTNNKKKLNTWLNLYKQNYGIEFDKNIINYFIK